MYFTGRKNAEKRRDGYVRNSACYNVLCHASSLDTQGDTLLVILSKSFTYRLTWKLIHFPVSMGIKLSSVWSSYHQHFRYWNLFYWRALGLLSGNWGVWGKRSNVQYCFMQIYTYKICCRCLRFKKKIIVHDLTLPYHVNNDFEQIHLL